MRRGGTGESGMTLVEMLVVLAIIGIAAGATVLGLGVATRGASVRAEAERLAAGLRLAQDDVMLGDRAIAFAWNGDAYAFPGSDGEGALADHRLAAGIRLVMPAAAGQARIGADDGSPPVTAVLTGGAQRWRVVSDGVTVSTAQVPGA